MKYIIKVTTHEYPAAKYSAFVKDDKQVVADYHSDSIFAVMQSVARYIKNYGDKKQ